MNLLKQLWNWLVKKTSTAPQLAAVEEEPTPVEVEESYKTSLRLATLDNAGPSGGLFHENDIIPW